MSYTNASVEQYKQALLYVRDKHHISGDHPYLKLIKYHALSEGAVTTATRLAEHLGYDSFGSANLHYGKYAHLVADALAFRPEKRSDDSYRWWMTFSSGNLAGNDTLDGQFELVMHPELLQALIEMKWVKLEQDILSL